MANKKTHEEFLKEFYEKNPNANNIEILEKLFGIQHQQLYQDVKIHLQLDVLNVVMKKVVIKD